MTIKNKIKELALENALKFNGKANPNALIGHIIKEFPEKKDDISHLKSEIKRISDEINSLSLTEQKKELKNLNPNFNKEQKKLKSERKEQRSNLPDIKNAEDGKVVTRMPPEPSKYNHLGHAMSFLINYLYAKKYNGRVILRLDDTNPEKSKEEYVKAIHEDIIEFLGLVPDEIKSASEHMSAYMDYALDLIKREHAYVCQCPKEEISEKRREMKDCAHRNQTVAENLELWNKMQKGELEEGTHVLRLKIDMQHKNAVMRDPIIYRLCYTPHYKTGEKYKVWPMYDFECAIEEAHCGVTHVFRSNEFDSRIELQNYIAELFGFHPVNYIHYGRYNVINATTKGREIRALIESGKYIGWDDPRLVTLRALKRRGITREAFYELVQKIGLSKTQTNIDFSSIAAINRSLLDKTAKRFFAIKEPVLIKIHNIPEHFNQVYLKHHQESKESKRLIDFTNEFYIEKEDFENIKQGQVLRLMDCMNIKQTKDNNFEYVSQNYDDFKLIEDKGGIIHYIANNGQQIESEILMDDLSVQKIICEQTINQLKQGEVIQFERLCFCRLDSKVGDDLKFWFTHK
jgi:glutamyl-tRNA synthetase